VGVAYGARDASVTRPVERSIDRPIPEWAEAMMVLSGRPAARADWAFPAIMVVRANDDAIPNEKMNPHEVQSWIRGAPQ
jgi:hypothetical protein